MVSASSFDSMDSIVCWCFVLLLVNDFISKMISNRIVVASSMYVIVIEFVFVHPSPLKGRKYIRHAFKTPLQGTEVGVRN